MLVDQICERITSTQAALERIRTGFQNSELCGILNVRSLQEDVAALDRAVSDSILRDDFVQTNVRSFKVGPDDISNGGAPKTIRFTTPNGPKSKTRPPKSKIRPPKSKIRPPKS